MAGAILQRIRHRVRGVSEGGGGVGGVASLKDVQGSRGRGSEANMPLASCVTHTGSTFAFRKRWGQIDWRSLGEYKT